MTITIVKLPKKIDKLYFGLILCDKKNVKIETIIQKYMYLDFEQDKIDLKYFQ